MVLNKTLEHGIYKSVEDLQNSFNTLFVQETMLQLRMFTVGDRIFISASPSIKTLRAHLHLLLFLGIESRWAVSSLFDIQTIPVHSEQLSGLNVKRAVEPIPSNGGDLSVTTNHEQDLSVIRRPLFTDQPQFNPLIPMGNIIGDLAANNSLILSAATTLTSGEVRSNTVNSVGNGSTGRQSDTQSVGREVEFLQQNIFLPCSPILDIYVGDKGFITCRELSGNVSMSEDYLYKALSCHLTIRKSTDTSDNKGLRLQKTIDPFYHFNANSSKNNLISGAYETLHFNFISIYGFHLEFTKDSIFLIDLFIN